MPDIGPPTNADLATLHKEEIRHTGSGINNAAVSTIVTSVVVPVIAHACGTMTSGTPY